MMSNRGDISEEPLHRIPYPNNMGIIRYVLALAVVFAHFNELTGSHFYFPITSYQAVGGFFSLSGFLIYASFRKRPGVRAFIVARMRRLLPAYFITVIGAAILLCLVSSLPATQYFLSGHFWKMVAIAVAVGLTCCSGFIPYYNIVLQPLTLSVIVIWVSIVGKWGTWEGKRDNISYNIYLCHFPVIQTLIVATRGAAWLEGLPGLAIACIATTLTAYLILLGEKSGLFQKILLPLGNKVKIEKKKSNGDDK